MPTNEFDGTYQYPPSPRVRIIDMRQDLEKFKSRGRLTRSNDPDVEAKWEAFSAEVTRLEKRWAEADTSTAEKRSALGEALEDDVGYANELLGRWLHDEGGFRNKDRRYFRWLGYRGPQ